VNPAESPWTLPGINQRLRELDALTGDKAMTMGEIAERLSFEFEVAITRNSVIGRRHRLNLPQRGPSPPPKARKRTEKPKMTHIRVDAPIAPELPIVENTTAGLDILQLRNNSCRWPLGDLMETRPPYLFCGKRTLFDRPYCRAHYERAVGKPIARAV